MFVSHSEATITKDCISAYQRDSQNDYHPRYPKVFILKMDASRDLRESFPWTTSPLVVSAPMLNIALASLAVEVSAAGGLGFLAGGFDVKALNENIEEAKELIAQHPLFATGLNGGVMPIGVGFLVWGCDMHASLAFMDSGFLPAAVWLFAPRTNSDLKIWAGEVREKSKGKTQVWVQIGCVSDALEVAKMVSPDVFIVQGSDAGGHGLNQAAGLMTLLPEIYDALSAEGFTQIPLVAAGGIIEGRAVAAALALGAAGVTMGTRFLASEEAAISKGYQNEIVRVADGGKNTVRSSVYDHLRGFHDWPEAYGGRGVINQSYLDAQGGMSDEENAKLYKKAMEQGDAGWGPGQRMTTYAGTGVGLVRFVKPAADIVREVRDAAIRIATRNFQLLTS